jgi:hypothetical protein
VRDSSVRLDSQCYPTKHEADVIVSRLSRQDQILYRSDGCSIMPRPDARSEPRSENDFSDEPEDSRLAIE